MTKPTPQLPDKQRDGFRAFIEPMVDEAMNSTRKAIAASARKIAFRMAGGAMQNPDGATALHAFANALDQTEVV